MRSSNIVLNALKQLFDEPLTAKILQKVLINVQIISSNYFQPWVCTILYLSVFNDNPFTKKQIN